MGQCFHEFIQEINFFLPDLIQCGFLESQIVIWENIDYFMNVFAHTRSSSGIADKEYFYLNFKRKMVNRMNHITLGCI